MNEVVMPERVAGHTWLYAMQAGDIDVFKIGETVDLTKRLKRAQKHRLYPVKMAFAFLIQGPASGVEGQLHACLSGYALRGDWFFIDPATLHNAMWHAVKHQIVQEYSAPVAP